jgi:50S ribosomal protein L16 3-hydroxylase
MRAQKPAVLGGLPVERFLRSYWQKEPLVVRRAFPNLRDPLSPDELAGLACEPSVDSRLVLQRGGKKPWQVIRGPQRPGALRKLPRSHWTLLVESADRQSAAIAALAAAFSFIPKWRMDDVMVSLAPVHGTVGAHIDSYDVFLIQGQGRRRWEVDRRVRADYRPGLDLRILKGFRAENSWELNPGDMLYVPPGVGHRGVTVAGGAEIALTYSVGFRAPSTADLLSALLVRLLAGEPALFGDAGRRAVRDNTEISDGDLAALRRFLLGDIETQNREAWTMALGQAVTSGGHGRGQIRVSGTALAKHLARGGAVAPIPGARLAWAQLERGRVAIFVNGESRVLPAGQAFAAPFLCGNGSPSSARRLASREALVSLARDLFRAGVIGWRD